MSRFLWASVFILGGCASTENSTAKCVESPAAVSVAAPMAEDDSGCDNENTVVQKIEALRARHIANELTADELYDAQGAVIDESCIKPYLPTVEDDLSPMGPGPVTRLRKLKSLLDAGMISQPDYDEKKKSILKTL